MSWARLDDLYDDHPKVMAVMHDCPTAAALHPQAITASARRESDGLVDPFWLIARVPDKKRRAEALTALVRERLFDEIPAGEQLSLSDDKGFGVTVGPFNEPRHVVHDFLDYNPSSAQLQDRRQKDAERKAKGRRADSEGSPAGHGADSAGSPAYAGTGGSAGADPQPLPVPVPSRSQEADASPSEPAEVAWLCQLLADLIDANGSGAKTRPASKAWHDPCRLMLTADKRPWQEVEQVIRWCQADGFWRSNVMSMAKLREKYPQLLLKMNAPAGRNSSPTTADWLAAGRNAA